MAALATSKTQAASLLPARGRPRQLEPLRAIHVARCSNGLLFLLLLPDYDHLDLLLKQKQQTKLPSNTRLSRCSQEYQVCANIIFKDSSSSQLVSYGRRPV